MDVRKLIDKLAKEEEALQKKDFLAPVVRGGSVCIRIRGIICRFLPEDSDFEGWGIFKPVSLHRVRVRDVAGKAPVRKYLAQLPAVEVILADPSGSTRWSVLAHPAGSPVKTEGTIPVHLVERAERFRHVIARFDGFNFWFERMHPGHNPALAAYLRKSLEADSEVETLRKPGLLPQEKKLYSELLRSERIRREEPGRRRIRNALEHAGAVLDSYYPTGEETSVTFLVDGVRHTSRIRTKDLAVLSAGICLSGEDDKFDLQSLVGVLREARRQYDFD